LAAKPPSAFCRQVSGGINAAVFGGASAPPAALIPARYSRAGIPAGGDIAAMAWPGGNMPAADGEL